MTSDPTPHADETGHSAEEELKWPIGFIVMIVLAGLYLIVRFVQLGGRLIDWLF